MSSISGISNNVNYTALSSGKRINSAADDAAGLAISNKLETQSNGLDVGANNALTGKDMINVADGALSSIQDSLQRMRELSVQASNTAVYSSSDISAMQKEIDGLKSSITDVASQTSFNTMKLLDGSKADYNLATNPQGGGVKLQMANATLEALGIEDFDVTGDFSIKTLDDALQKISDARSSLGAQSNGLDRTVSFNNYASYNTTSANSKISDTDFGKEISEQKKNETLQQYRLMAQKKKMEDEQKRMSQLFNM